MLAMIDISWSTRDAINKLSREDYNNLRSNIEQLQLAEWREGKDEPPPNYINCPILIDLMVDGPILAKYGLEFTIKRFKGTYVASKGITSNGDTYNLHVAIPAVGLLMMNEVQVLEDACTHYLQDHLNEGWRIIAVCPPDAVRRPTYIIGRHKEK